MQIGKEISILKVNRNIKAVDFKETLAYTLCPVTLSVVFTDGSKRSTAKSKFLKKLGVSDAIVSNTPQQIHAYILNVMAKIRSLHGKPDTIEDFVLKLINSVHFAADSYFHNSIKTAERKTRRENRTVIIKSIKSKVPTDFQSFIKNNESKTGIIDLLPDQ